MKQPIEQFIGKLGSSQELTDEEMEAVAGGSGQIIYLNVEGGTYTPGWTNYNNLGLSSQTNKHQATITPWRDSFKEFVIDGQCSDADED